MKKSLSRWNVLFIGLDGPVTTESCVSKLEGSCAWTHELHA
jgi:hypothetical protein